MQSAVLSGVGILALMVLGWSVAGRLARWRFWWIGLIPPLLLVGGLIAERWFPGWRPVSWVIHGRREFVLLAISIPLLLGTLGRQLPAVRQRHMVQVLAVLLTLRVSLSPFLAPAFTYSQQSELETIMDRDGICLQSNGYNCGPAAAVTVLRRRGIPAEEGELALAAHTTQLTGTPVDCLVNAIHEMYGAQCSVEHADHLDALQGHVPFIAVVRHSFMVDHYVVVLKVTESCVQLGDPLKGLKQLTRAEFDRKWRKQAVVFKP